MALVLATWPVTPETCDCYALAWKVEDTVYIQCRTGYYCGDSENLCQTIDLGAPTGIHNFDCKCGTNQVPEDTYWDDCSCKSGYGVPSSGKPTFARCHLKSCTYSCYPIPTQDIPEFPTQVQACDCRTSAP
jgi:hypothetical protein